MNRLSLSLLLATAVFTTELTLAGEALAEPPTGADPAAAQALFYEARSLMKAGKYSVACPKLEESLKLDYGIGTEFNLADCNEKLGKLSAAWSSFINVASAAKTQNQPQREKVARERAKSLEARLPKLTIDVAATATPGLEVTRDGIAVGAASYGSAVPIDPGTHKIVASAPGRQSWEGTVNVAEGKAARIAVPALAVAAVAEGAPAAPAPGPVAHPHVETAAVDVRPEPAAAFPPPIIERGQTQRAVGWVTSGVGLVGLGVAAGFGLSSLQNRADAKNHCDGAGFCDAQGVEMRDKAMSSGNVSTIAAVAGGTLLVGGLVVLLTAPKTAHKETGRAGSFRAVPLVGLNGGGLSLQGALP